MEETDQIVEEEEEGDNQAPAMEEADRRMKEVEEDEVPQSKPLLGMVPNSAGGFSWAVDDMRQLRCFLCLGSENGTYYIVHRRAEAGSRICRGHLETYFRRSWNRGGG